MVYFGLKPGIVSDFYPDMNVGVIKNLSLERIENNSETQIIDSLLRHKFLFNKPEFVSKGKNYGSTEIPIYSTPQESIEIFSLPRHSCRGKEKRIEKGFSPITQRGISEN